ncbi:MAG: DUF5938 domain-containing protein [Desulfuromonadales bacterium]|nr:DUF5938 domain-containing protein [Desulfuromonadales bacterium]
MAKKPVVIYGANGYTGRLIAEYLREYQIPFIAAGRSREKIEDVMSRVPGIETADYEVVEVKDTVEDLTELLTGCKVLCNTVGPFVKYAETAIQASLNAGVHYIDTSGEQEYLRTIKEKFGPAYAEKGLVLSPSTAYMHAPLDIAANIVLENEAIHTLECSVLVQGIPTFGSTQTIFAMLGLENCFLQDNEYVEWPRAKGYEVSFPGRLATNLCHPWGGGPLPVWFKDTPQVRNLRQLTAFNNREMFEQLIDLQKHYEENIRPLPKEEAEAMMSKMAADMQPGMPPRENRLIHQSFDVVCGRGNSETRTCIIRSGPPYLMTGALQAAAADKLLSSGPEKVGFASPCEAFGYKYLLGAMKNFFPTEVEIF